MFYAKQLKPGQSVKVTQEDGGEILHLSQVCMSKPVDNNRSYLKIVQGSQSFAACVLQKDKQESSSIDLFLSTREDLQLTVEGGKNELSVIGYFEPEPESESEDEDEQIPGFGEESDASDAASDEEVDGMSAPVMKDGRIEDLDAVEGVDAKRGKQKSVNKKAQALKELQAAAAKDDVSDDDDDKSDEGEGDDDDESDGISQESGDEGGDQEGSEDEPSAPVPQENKRKGQQQQPANKKAKTQGGDTPAGKGDEATYKSALVDFLKKNGRTPLASLGQKIKKPASISKMAVFLKARPEVFVVDAGFCSLK